jgi:membrane protein
MPLTLAAALLKETYIRWSERQGPRLGASVAFYSILSFSPLLVLVTAVIALVFGHESAKASLISEAREWIGTSGAETVQTLLSNAQQPASGLVASALAIATLLFGASGVVIELQDALNLMWEVPTPTGGSITAWIKQRVFSFGMILSVGFLLLVFLMLSAALAFIGHYFGSYVPLPSFVLQAINFVISFIAVAGLFALMFKYLPDAKISWKDVSIGALGTALLFSIGKLLLGLYLGRASVGSAYGAAGSLVAAVVWIYYSAQIFFFGAEFTSVYAGRAKMQSERNPALGGKSATTVTS